MGGKRTLDHDKTGLKMVWLKKRSRVSWVHMSVHIVVCSAAKSPEDANASERERWSAVLSPQRLLLCV
jgi:hypothetical protein